MSALVLKDFAGAPEITKTAFQLREDALVAAKPVKKVETESELHSAVAVLHLLKELRNGLELSRKEVKSPVLALSRLIDEKAADFIQPCHKEENRIQGMVNHFQRKQIEAKRAEEQRIERLQRAAENEQDPAKKTALALEADLSTSITVTKPKGLVTRVRMNFQVTDAHVFCQAYPEFFKWNEKTETLKLDRMRIIDELNREDGRGMFHRSHFPEELPTENNPLVNPPGLRVFEDIKTHAR